MDDLAIGRMLRIVRVKRGLRQEDVAEAAAVSQSTVSRLELGRLEGIQLGTLRRVAAVVGVRVTVEMRGPGAELDRLLGAHHSAMHEEVARLFERLPDWVALPEVTFALRGERGAIDVLAWHAGSRCLLVIELKTELVDVQETVGTLDRKVRLATEIAREQGWDPLSVSTWLLIAEAPANRRAVGRHAAMLRSRLAADGHAMTRWLHRPSGSIRALSFLSSTHAAGTGQRLAPVRRVRRARTGAVAGRR
jgi:transcriptional regulator with XRE-family HTH domain